MGVVEAELRQCYFSGCSREMSNSRNALNGLSLVLVGVVFAVSAAPHCYAADQSTASMPTWKSINANRDYKVEGSGDPFRNGAWVSISSVNTTSSEYGGAIANVPASNFRGRWVTLHASLAIDAVASDGAIWLRADRGTEPLAFTTSAGQPSNVSTGGVERSIALLVPDGADVLAFGVVMSGAGTITATDIRIGVHMKHDRVDSDALAVLDEALSIVSGNALYAGEVDWERESEALRTKFRSIGGTRDSAYLLIRELLSQLKDRHSFFMMPEEVVRFERSGVERGESKVHLIDDGIGYIRIDGYVGVDAARSQEFSRRVSRQIEGVAPSVSNGWILDLRQNSGGNMWPMLSALSSFLGHAPLGFFQDREGTSSPWLLEDSEGEAAIDLQESRVAVLVGSRTASSGEALALAFRGRPNSMSFGKRTAGLATGNTVFKLRDGSQILLTTSLLLDRGLDSHVLGVVPDEIVEHSATDDEELFRRTINWLKGR